MRYFEKMENSVKKGRGVFIAPTASVFGNVVLGDEVSIWFGAVLRGDTDLISIGNRSNVQDNAVVHADPGVPAIIGEEVIIGHGAIVHGAKIANNVLIGMGSIVLNNASIGEFSIIGAGALITEGKVIPPYSVVVGNPGRVVKQLSPEHIGKVKRNAEAYVELAKKYLDGENGI